MVAARQLLVHLEDLDEIVLGHSSAGSVGLEGANLRVWGARRQSGRAGGQTEEAPGEGSGLIEHERFSWRFAQLVGSLANFHVLAQPKERTRSKGDSNGSLTHENTPEAINQRPGGRLESRNKQANCMTHRRHRTRRRRRQIPMLAGGDDDGGYDYGRPEMVGEHELCPYLGVVALGLAYCLETRAA